MEQPPGEDFHTTFNAQRLLIVFHQQQVLGDEAKQWCEKAFQPYEPKCQIGKDKDTGRVVVILDLKYPLFPSGVNHLIKWQSSGQFLFLKILFSDNHYLAATLKYLYSDEDLRSVFMG